MIYTTKKIYFLPVIQKLKKKIIKIDEKNYNKYSIYVNDSKDYLEERIEFTFKFRTNKLLEKLSKLRIEDQNKNK